MTVFKVLPEFERTNQTENIELLKKTALGKGEPGVEQLQAVYSLVVEGSKRLRPTTKITNDAEFLFDGAVKHVGGGVYSLDNPRLRVRAEGKFRVQFEVLGIISSPYDGSHDIVVDTYSNVAVQQVSGSTPSPSSSSPCLCSREPQRTAADSGFSSPSSSPSPAYRSSRSCNRTPKNRGGS